MHQQQNQNPSQNNYHSNNNILNDRANDNTSKQNLFSHEKGYVIDMQGYANYGT
jgi:hypothetical protein